MTDRVISGTASAVDSGGLTQDEVYKFKERINQLELLTPPIGAILAYLGVGMGNGTNGGTKTFPFGSTIATIRTYVENQTGGKWTICDGHQIVDATSPLNGKYTPNLDDARFLQGDTAMGTQAGVNTQDTPVAISGGICAARASFCNNNFSTCTNNASWVSCSVSYNHSHSMTHNHLIGRQNSGFGILSINPTPSNTTEYSGGTEVGRNGGSGVDTSITTLNRNPGYDWFSWGAREPNGGQKNYTGTCSISFNKCLWNANQTPHSHTFVTNCLNNATYQTTHAHGHTITADATPWDNRPQYLTSFFIMRIK